VLFTAAIARTELVRAVARSGLTDIVANARRALTKLDLVAISPTLLDAGATIGPAELQTLDAIHLAAARTAPDLRALITYDDRLAGAAVQAWISVVTPA
jgi:predicted nucleic acid-binding protein